MRDKEADKTYMRWWRTTPAGIASAADYTAKRSADRAEARRCKGKKDTCEGRPNRAWDSRAVQATLKIWGGCDVQF